MIDFPFWLRYAHFINVIFITLLIRSGIEILSSLPKLYFKDDAKPGTEWIKFTKKKIPKDRLWISLEEEESFSSWIALPGHKNLGLGRHWHFISALFWFGNGVAYYTLLFTSGEWVRLVPTSWNIFPNALQYAMSLVSMHPMASGNPYDPLQQLTYFFVVFFLGPFMIATGAAMSPAIGARFPWYPKIFRGRQTARSLHFLGMLAFVLFIVAHLAMVILNKFPENMGNIVLGDGKGISIATAIGLFAFYCVSVLIVHIWSTGISLHNPRFTQKMIGAILIPLKRSLFGKVVSRQQHSKSEITPFFRINGYPPDTIEYKELYENSFADWKLEIFGLVEKPRHYSLKELQKIAKQEQITEHSCIQGWTGIAQWGGVPMIEIVKQCKPLAQARYVVFRSYQTDANGEFYEVISMELANHPQTILAYQMNYKPLTEAHGAPLRLRVETQLGYKMVKWLRSIEFVSDYQHIGKGRGGHREDNMYYDITAAI